MPVGVSRDRYVYALYAGRQTKPCYIGVGKGGRLRPHLAEARRGFIGPNSRKARTLIACLKREIVIVPRKLLWNMTIDQANAVERALVAHYGRRDLKTGCLLN